MSEKSKRDLRVRVDGFFSNCEWIIMRTAMFAFFMLGLYKFVQWTLWH